MDRDITESILKFPKEIWFIIFEYSTYASIVFPLSYISKSIFKLVTEYTSKVTYINLESCQSKNFGKYEKGILKHVAKNCKIINNINFGEWIPQAHLYPDLEILTGLNEGIQFKIIPNNKLVGWVTLWYRYPTQLSCIKMDLGDVGCVFATNIETGPILKCFHKGVKTLEFFTQNAPDPRASDLLGSLDFFNKGIAKLRDEAMPNLNNLTELILKNIDLKDLSFKHGASTGSLATSPGHFILFKARNQLNLTKLILEGCIGLGLMDTDFWMYVHQCKNLKFLSLDLTIDLYAIYNLILLDYLPHESIEKLYIKVVDISCTLQMELSFIKFAQKCKQVKPNFIFGYSEWGILTRTYHGMLSNSIKDAGVPDSFMNNLISLD